MKEITNQFYYKNNRIQQLKGFYATAQFKSVSKAAENLLLTPASISLQIKTLERDLETKLFIRKRKEMVLTEDGEMLYRLSAPCLQSIDGMFEKFLFHKKNRLEKKIHIALHHIAISYLLPKYLKIFKDKYRDVKVIIHNISAGAALKRLRRDEIDIMLYPTSEVPEDCVFRPAFSYETLLIMHKDHELAKYKEEDITLEDIGRYDLIRIDAQQIVLPMFEDAVKHYGIGSNISFENGEWEMLKHFVNEKMGLAMVSTICLNEKDDPNLVGKKMSKIFPNMTYGIMIKKGRFITPAMENFINIVDDKFLNYIKE